MEIARAELSDMEHLDKEGIYVAELRVPTYFYLVGEERDVVPNPAEFNISKGYWVLRPSKDPSVIDEYNELILVIEFPHKSLKEAEDHALGVGRTFSSITSAYAGYPLGAPQLHRMAFKDFEGHLITQSNYWYGHKSHMLSTFDQLVKYQFQKYLKQVSSVDAKTRYSLLAALHWYGISLDAHDPTFSFVAAWTGLECIGKVIHSKFHPNGPKAPCKVCCNEAGKDRNRKMAGIEHMFRTISKNALPDSISKESKNING